MTTLTSSATITIGDGSTVTEQASVVVIPAAGVGEGNGRLIHPTLGTYDYDMPPNQWVNLHGDVIVAPIWASEKTLSSVANTLWQGVIRDVVIEEHWNA